LLVVVEPLLTAETEINLTTETALSVIGVERHASSIGVVAT